MGHVCQAIVTKYFGPSNVRGSRIKATAQAGSVTVPFDGALDTNDNHLAAAIALANKYGWLTSPDDGYGSRLEGGALPSGDGNCYVVVSAKPEGIASMGDWRDVAIDALQSQPEDPTRAAMRAISVIAEEIGTDKVTSAARLESPLAQFAKLGTWTRENSATFLLNGVPTFFIQSEEYDRRRAIGHAGVGDIAEAIEETLQMYKAPLHVEIRTPKVGERGWWVTNPSPDVALQEVLNESEDGGFVVEEDMLATTRALYEKGANGLYTDADGMSLITVVP